MNLKTSSAVISLATILCASTSCKTGNSLNKHPNLTSTRGLWRLNFPAEPVAVICDSRNITNMIIAPHGKRVDHLRHALSTWVRKNPQYTAFDACEKVYDLVRETVGGYNSNISTNLAQYRSLEDRYQDLENEQKKLFPEKVQKAIALLARGFDSPQYLFLTSDQKKIIFPDGTRFGMDFDDLVSATAEEKERLRKQLQVVEERIVSLQRQRASDRVIDEAYMAFIDLYTPFTRREWERDSKDAALTLVEWRNIDGSTLSPEDLQCAAHEAINYSQALVSGFEAKRANIPREYKENVDAIHRSPTRIPEFETMPTGTFVCGDYAAISHYCLSALGITNLISCGVMYGIDQPIDKVPPFGHVWITLPQEKVIFDPTSSSFKYGWWKVEATDNPYKDKNQVSQKQEISVGDRVYRYTSVETSPKYIVYNIPFTSQEAWNEHVALIGEIQAHDVRELIWNLYH